MPFFRAIKMKYAITLIVAAILLFACSKESVPPSPILSGDLLSIEVTDRPMTSTSFSWDTFAGGKIHFYETFVVLTTPDGVSRSATFDRIRNLKFRE